MSIVRWAATTAVLVALVTVSVPCASATTTEVVPGNGTLQAAIDAASAGDTLKLQAGIYTGPVVLNKDRLTLKMITGQFAAIIDGDCAAPIALDIAADKVRVDGIRVVGGTATEIRIANHTQVRLRGLGAGPKPCGTEQNGIEVSGTSTRVQLLNCQANSLPGAGVYLNGLARGARVQFRHSGPFKYMHTQIALPGGDSNAIGLLIQDCADGAPLAQSEIEVTHCAFKRNSVAGVRLVNSDGIRIRKDLIEAPSSGSGAIGIDLDATSDANLITSNTWNDPDMMNTPYVDNGTGNCAKDNSFAAPSCP